MSILLNEISDISTNFFYNNIKADNLNYKRLRKNNAIELPELINQNMLPKYVVYYKECYNKEKKLYREFFKIEKHPLIHNNKLYISSKSNKFNILEKLQQIKTILSNIENSQINTNICDNSNNIVLPKYISLKKKDSKYYLFYDKKNDNKRETLKKLYNIDISLENNVLNFLKKINTKYNSDIIYE